MTRHGALTSCWKSSFPAVALDVSSSLQSKVDKALTLMAQIPTQPVSLLWPVLDLTLSKSLLEKGELGGYAQLCVWYLLPSCHVSTRSGKDAECPHSCCSLICRLQLGNAELET